MSENIQTQDKQPRLTVVIPTRERNEQTHDYIDHIQETAGCPVDVVILVNPDNVSLTTTYSQILQSPHIKCKTVVFIHDDLEFLRKGWALEVVRLFEEHEDYGIIGIAGSAEFDQNGAWWQYDKKYGQVLHRKDGKSWLTEFSPLLKEDLQEVCVIDGLFMAIRTDRITDDFDTNIPGFNFYDIDFCLSNFLTHQTKIGVTTNIRVAHNSVGDIKPEWYTNRDYVNKKYEEYYPILVEPKKINKRNNKRKK